MDHPHEGEVSSPEEPLPPEPSQRRQRPMDHPHEGEVSSPEEPLPPFSSPEEPLPPAPSQRRQRPMDQFPDGYPVRLRSAVHGTYLHADKDGHGVSLSRRRRSMKVAWVVHRYYGDNQHVLLHSAAYGRYLAATDVSAPLRCRGFRVEQRNYDELEDAAIRWQPLIRQSRDEILLRRLNGDRYAYLRANGRYQRWNANVVSVDSFYNISSMMEWVVEPIPSSERIPRLRIPARPYLSDLLLSRVIMFNGNGDDGFSVTATSFAFRGRSVFNLRDELAKRLGIARNVSHNLVMYVRAGTFGRFTPLVANLSRSSETLAITADMPANGGPRHPDFDAE